MSSSNKKTFKTSEASKAAGTTVTSDAISLDPTTTDHVLVVTSDSSANLTGNVDVELEMSPDGDNWCPAKIKTTTTSSGSGSAIVGNEKFVDLTATGTGTDYKNNYARGRKTYDMSTNQLYTGSETDEELRTDAVDFMHHMIAVNKSFNYSGWYKTSEQPSTTYNPVLFRHGGHDDFSNAKTVQLTHGNANSNALQIPANNSTTVETGMIISDTNYNASPFYISTDTTPTQDLPDVADGWSTSFWLKFDSLGTNTNWVFNDILRLDFSNGDHFVVRTARPGGASGNPRRIRLFYRNSAKTTQLQVEFDISSYTTGDWHQFVVTSKGEGTNGKVDVSETASDNDLKLYIDGSEITPRAGQTLDTTYTIDSSSSLTVSNVALNMRATTSYSSTLDTLSIDELAFYKGDVDVASLYANRLNVEEATLPANTVLTALWRMGDNPSDVISPVTSMSIRNNISTNDSRLVHNSTMANPSFVTLTSSDNAFSGKTTQNLAEVIQRNELAIRKDNIIDYKINYELKGTNKNLFNNNNNMPSIEDPFTISFTGFLHTNGFFDTIIGQHATSTRNHFKIFYLSDDLTISFAGGGAVNDIKCSAASIDQVFSHIVIVKEQGLPSTSTVKFYIDGVLQTTAQGYSSGTLSTTAWNTLNVGQVSFQSASRSFSVNSQYAGTASRTSGNRDTIDQIACFSKALSDINPGDNPISAGDTAGGEIATLYNSGNYHDLLNLASSFNLKKYFKCGDGANDNRLGQLVKAYDVVNNAEYIESVSANPSEYYEYNSDPSNLPSNYRLQGGISQDIFTTTSNLSISGWFKTTDTGILFSNSSNGTNGLLFDIQSSVYQLKFGSVSTIQAASSGIRDGQWHHIVITKAAKDGSNLSETKIYIDGTLASTTSVGSTLADADLRGSNGFTLLSNGENNVHASSPANIDTSKLKATISNWSLHGEVLSANAVKQLYSNGHVRNIKNLPSVTASSIEAWWQLADTTNPQNDLIAENNLQYQYPLDQLANIKYITGADGTSTGAVPDWELSGTNKNVFATDTSDMLSINDAWSISMKVDFPRTSGSNQYRTFFSMFTDLPNTGAGIQLVHQRTTGSGGFQILRVGVSDGSNYWYRDYQLSNPTNEFGHLVVVKNAGGFGSSTDPFTVYWENSVASTAGSIGGSGQSSLSWSGQTVGDVHISGYHKYFVANNQLTKDSGLRKIDNVACYPFVLTSNDVNSLHNSSSYYDPNLISGATAIFRMGDGANDANDEIFDTKGDTTRKFVKGGTGNETITNLLTTDNIYSTGFTGPGPLTDNVVNATGATLIQDSLNGNAMTLSLTKNFDFTSESWVTDSSGEASFCLSFNGHEDQAEYFALWKCNQTGKNINFLDGNWHNVVLSYRASSAEGQNIRFGPLDDINNKQDFNWNLSVDGREYNDINSSIGADYIGGLNTLLVETVASNSENTGFAIYNRHLKYDTSNNEETYKAHGQAGSNITEDSGANSANAYQGSIDETSFHSQNFWVSSGGEEPTNFESEYPATIYGSTTGLSGTRGTGATYAEGIPYPLNDPAAIGATAGTSQYINPNRYDASTNPGGGLEAWWRWGDTAGDCNENINDAVDFAIDVTNNNHDLRAQNFNDQRVVGPLTTPASTGESIYLASQEASSGSTTTTTLIDVVIEGIVDTACNVKDLALPVLQYLRVKFTGAGSTDLGSGKTEASLWYAKRRKR